MAFKGYFRCHGLDLFGHIEIPIIQSLNPKQILFASILVDKTGLDNLSSLVKDCFVVDDSDTLDERLYMYLGVEDSGDRLYG